MPEDKTEPRGCRGNTEIRAQRRRPRGLQERHLVIRCVVLQKATAEVMP